MPTTQPMSMTQARTTLEPIMRLDRDDARVAEAHRAAAARPPRIAVTRRKCGGFAAGSWRAAGRGRLREL